MVKAELEKTLSKEAVYKSAQEGKNTSITAQIGDTINAVDSVIADLRTSQNGDPQGNEMANELISALAEIRGNTIRQNPVIVWQNTSILPRPKLKVEEPTKPEIHQVFEKEKPKPSIKPRVPTRAQGITSSSPRKSEQPPVLEPVTISEFAAKHYLPEAQIVEIARDHFNWGLSEPSEQLSPRQQRLLSFYVEHNLKAAPEGFMTIFQVCQKLGISEKRWHGDGYRKKYNLTPFKIGNATFFKEGDIDQIAAERQQRVNQRMSPRSERKPQFDEEFEEYMEDSREDYSNDLDITSIHLKEVGEIPMEIKNHWKWNAKIFISQMAANILPVILEHGNLTPEQKEQITKILDNNVVKIILGLFQSRLTEALSKKVLDNVIQKISNGQKLDNTDEFFINSVQNQTTWIIDKLSNVGRIMDPEKRESELQKLIDRQIYLVNEGVNARDKLTKANLRLTVSIAKRYAWSGLTLLDLEDYGVEGLMKAAVKFDWRKGYRFSTYATNWIRQAIGRAIQDHSDTIRVPIHIHERMSKYMKEAERVLQEGEDIDREDLINKVDPTGNLARGLRTRNLLSLDDAVRPDGDLPLEDFIKDENDEIDESLGKIGLQEDLMAAVNTLPPRERKVLMLRYGLEDGVSRTLEQVAREFELTRERIRQIEAHALRKLRRPSIARKLKPYLDDDPRAISISPGQAVSVPRGGKNK